MSQAPTDWSYAEMYGDEEEEAPPLQPTAPIIPPPPAPKKGRTDVKALAREKVSNMRSLVDAARFLYSALDSLNACAEDDLRKLEARKPRAAKAPAPTASKAALACEDAVVSKGAGPRNVKRVRRAASPEAPVVQHGSGGAGGASAVNHYDTQHGRYGPGPRAAQQHTGVHTGVLGYKCE